MGPTYFCEATSRQVPKRRCGAVGSAGGVVGWMPPGMDGWLGLDARIKWDPYWVGIKQCKSMVILREFPSKNGAFIVWVGNIMVSNRPC